MSFTFNILSQKSFPTTFSIENTDDDNYGSREYGMTRGKGHWTNPGIIETEDYQKIHRLKGYLSNFIINKSL